eukprot:RCo020188
MAASLGRSLRSTVAHDHRPSENCLDPVLALNLTTRQVLKIKEITQICLSGREVTAIHPNFSLFENLDGLWLNDNKITRLENLMLPAAMLTVSTTLGSSATSLPRSTSPAPQRTTGASAGASFNSSRATEASTTRTGAYRLRELHLQNNLIETLNGDLTAGGLRFLEVLLLGNNKLRNLEVVVEILRPLQYLKQLELSGNPLANEPNYRQIIIHTLPSLAIFDRQCVSEEERAAAAVLLGQRMDSTARSAFGRSLPPPKPKTKVPLLSASVRALEETVSGIKARDAAAVAQQKLKEEQELAAQAKARAEFRVPEPGTHSVLQEGLNRRNAVLRESQKEQTQAAVFALLLPNRELRTIRGAFEQGRALRRADCVTILQTLGLPLPSGGPAQAQLDELLRQSFPADSAGGAGGIPLEGFLQAITRWPLFCKHREEALHTAAQLAIKEGRNAEALQIHKDIHVLSDYLRAVGVP